MVTPSFACGRRSAKLKCCSLPEVVNATISREGLNSANTCRQAPHGTVGSLLSVAIAINRKSVFPEQIAAATAARSAQMVSPKDAFSTFAPTNTLPDAVKTAAPTLNPEYGAYAS